MRKALEGYSEEFRIGRNTIHNLRYADDIVLVATSYEELRELMKREEQAGTEFNMHISATKTKVMTNADCKVTVTMNGFVLLAIGMNTMTKTLKMWKNKTITNNTKLRLVKALVWSVMSYGCETWTLNQSKGNKNTTVENKCMRKILTVPWTPPQQCINWQIPHQYFSIM